MAIEEGTPFAFCGRIIEAYYTNPELDTIGVIWSDGEKNCGRGLLIWLFRTFPVYVWGIPM